MSPPVRVFFLWHFHQPWYRELDGRPAALPWVRLHALKDYADLPRILAEEPRVPHTANLVPGLLDQVALLSRGASDRFLDVARAPAAAWDRAAADFVLENFFSIHPSRIESFPHYAGFARRRDRAASEGPDALLREFTTDELRDIVVLFHLAWSGETLQRDPLLVRLRRRGHRFSEKEKDALLDRQLAYLSEVIPAWKRAFESGVVEAATSPYHHPILPLLADTASAREAVREMPLPEHRFHRPEDAREQIALGLATFESHFGFRPRGMWPPEGAISAPALALIAEAGIEWAASDEEVLVNSLPPSEREFGPGDKARAVFRPYRLPGRSPAVFFRDRVLSDRIGFSYATWTAQEAAADFVARLIAIREAAPEAELVVPVILDGENAWESYPENGAPFLRALAAALAKESEIETTTPARVLARTEPKALERIVTGSWVNGTLATWIGTLSKNRAWDLLARTRDELATDIARAGTASPLAALEGKASPEEVAKAALFAAEASDWFWWFGCDHTSAQDAVFDELFRAHLATAYRALSKDVPPELLLPVEGEKRPEPILTLPPLFPTVDGARPDYFEWLGAGRLTSASRGTMNRSAGLLKEVLFGAGFAGPDLFLRLDPILAPASRSLAGTTLRVSLAPGGDGGAYGVTHELRLEPGVSERAGCRIGVGRIVEARLPYPAPSPEEPVALRLVLLDAEGRVLEAFPAEGWVRFRTQAADWSA